MIINQKDIFPVDISFNYFILNRQRLFMNLENTIKMIIVVMIVFSASTTIADAIRYHADTLSKDLNKISQECRH